MLALAAIAYVPYGLRSAQPPRGGSTLGLIYGSTGFAFMLFAGLLGLRKKFPVWRVGRAQAWMRGHLWLGLVSFPLILLHGGFHFGGPLTSVLMWLFVFVFASGLLGAALQHFMPRVHTTQLPMETIYEQIDRVRGQLAEEATRLVDETCAALEGDVSSATENQRAMAAGAGANWDVTVASGMQVDEKASDELRRFLQVEIQPFLDVRGRMEHGSGHLLWPRPCSGSCVFWCRPTCIPTSTISRTSARRNANSTGSPGFTRSCTVGCSCTFRFPTRCFCWARGTRWQL